MNVQVYSVITIFKYHLNNALQRNAQAAMAIKRRRMFAKNLKASFGDQSADRQVEKER